MKHQEPAVDSASPSRRGQSLVEFALVLPMLLVLLLGIADFGRVFQAGIATEAAARNAAEVGALERLRQPPPSDSSQWNSYYGELHRRIAAVACDEAAALPTPDDYRAGPA
ncbi:MAG TPA: TadE/TadG family type IV pilus assembly protein, partial [Candidatus Limnocylindria bacterium]|nr:TadE/TadG family type IV pilus assembly protein [Candidatus Limnocylindria bacterium]